MESTEIFRRMAHNNAWANARLHRAVGALDDAAYRAPRTGFFPSLHLTLSHILFVDLFYVDALLAGGRGAAVWPESDNSDGEGRLPVPRPSPAHRRPPARRRHRGPPHPPQSRREGVARARQSWPIESCGDVLLHLFQHQIHHRGQAHAMLSGTAVPPPQLDEFFPRRGAATPRGRAPLARPPAPLTAAPPPAAAAAAVEPTLALVRRPEHPPPGMRARARPAPPRPSHGHPATGLAAIPDAPPTQVAGLSGTRPTQVAGLSGVAGLSDFRTFCVQRAGGGDWYGQGGGRGSGSDCGGVRNSDTGGGAVGAGGIAPGARGQARAGRCPE